MTDLSVEARLRIQVLLTFQVSLLGMVMPGLRAVTVSWSETRIDAHMYYEHPVGEVEAELASEVEAEVCAGFPDHQVRVRAEHVETPQPLSERMLPGGWVYRRREASDE